MTQDTALAVIEPQASQDISLNWTPDDLKALQETVAKGCNASQFKVFLAACKRLQLDPFARQIVPIIQGGMTPQVTIDGFRLIAERTRKYRGQVGPYWCGPDGEWQDKWISDTPPAGCKVGVIREGFAEVMWGFARTKAYAKGGQWVTMPDVMIAKVAESLALRKAFPNELSGVYTREEMQQALGEDDDANFVDSEPTPIPQSAKVHEQSAHEWTKAEISALFGRWQVLQPEGESFRMADRFGAAMRQFCGHGAPFSNGERDKFAAKIERDEAARKKAADLNEEYGYVIDESSAELTPDTEQPHDLRTLDASKAATA